MTHRWTSGTAGRGSIRLWLAGAAVLALAPAPQSPLRADIAPARPERHTCGIPARIERVVASKSPLPTVEAYATAAVGGRVDSALQFAGVRGARTRRATAIFVFSICGVPASGGRLARVRAKADWPGLVAPASVRYVTVRSVNAVTVGF